MKRLLILCSVLCLISSSAIGQQYRFGVHLSPTINWISSNQPRSENNVAVKMAYGLIAEYQWSDYYSILSGIDIINRGGTFEVADTSGKYTAGFVQLPIALKLRTREFGYMTYFAKFGGSLGIETGERTEFNPEIPSNRAMDSYINAFTANFVFGGGVEYSLGARSAIIVGLDYNRSLIDNLKDADTRLEEEYNYRFDYLNLTIGFLF